MQRFALIALKALLLVMMSQAQAHLLNMTEVRAEVAESGTITLDINLDLLRATGSAQNYFALARQGPAALSAESNQDMWESLVDAIELDQSGQRNKLELIQVRTPPAELEIYESPVKWPMTRLLLTGDVEPGDPVTLRFRSSFPFEEPIAVSFTTGFNELKKSRWLIANQRSPDFIADPMGLAQAEKPGIDWGEMGSAIWQGVIHVVPGGIDHLLFLLCLFLATSTWRERVITITLFTLAHSLTLALAAYSVIELPSAWIESAIAASILVVALGNLTPQRKRASNALLILAFGLLHGFGFAGALRDLVLPAEGFLTALLAFNVGVELGQLAFLVLLSAALWHASKQQWFEQRVVLPLSALSALISATWLIQRLATI